MNKTNCAIYVRKSTEHGLEQEFNSLDNQELACKSYIASQTFQGWEFVKTYSDGGISGGTMARPGLQEMLDDIRAGKIQCVLVYKIDRLSRSIYDFKRMMKEDFEKHDCNLVSITQSFDTSTAMGKLTLNMLLSFAEFEREVASERVRDKMYATKTKGMWVGGTPPLGYDIKFKKLEPNENEIPQVKEIFETYLAATGLNQCRDIVEEKGIRGKQWTTKTGEVRGGGILSLKSVHNILRNATYIGKLPHKRTGEIFEGQHEAILDKELYDAVQKKLADNNICGDCPRSRGAPLLHQKVFAADGKRFVNKKGNKGQIKYRYYRNGKTSLPSGDIENIVRDTLKKFLDSDMAGLPDTARLAFKQVDFTDSLVTPMVEKVVYHEDKLTLFVKLDNLSYLTPFKNEKVNHSAEPMNGCYVSADGKHVILEKQIFINRFGMKSNRYIGSGISVLTKSENANNLIRAMAMGWRYRKMYETGKTINEIRLGENVADRTVYKYLNLAYLSPRIAGAVMDSEVPSHVNLQTLFGIASKYEDFGKQEQAFFGC